MTLVEDSVDQDQAAQNVQPDLGSTQSALVKPYTQKQRRKRNYFGRISGIKIYDRFFLSINPLPHMPILGSSNSAAN